MTLAAPSPATPPGDLPSMTVADLIANLARLEDDLREAPPLVALRGRLVVNPHRRRLVARQQAVIGELRARRTSLRTGTDEHGRRTRPASGNRLQAAPTPPSV